MCIRDSKSSYITFGTMLLGFVLGLLGVIA